MNHYEQENAVINENNANLSSVNRFNVMKTPMKKRELNGKTPSNKSTRKAFGNVSNVLGSSVSKSLANSSVKPKLRVKGDAKIIDHVKQKADEEWKNKYSDDIETMDCIIEEELSEINDPITHDLFAIDDSVLYSMGMDDEFNDHLIGHPLTNEDIEEIFGHTITDEEIEDIFGHAITYEDIDEICDNAITDEVIDDIF